MFMDKRYYLPNLLEEYRRHKHHIQAYLRGESVEDYIESYDGDSGLFGSLGVVGWLVVVTIMIMLWVLAIWFLLRQWPQVGLVGGLISAIVLVVPGLGPVVSIVITLIASGTGGWGQKLDPVLSGRPLVRGR
jgi:hypothetical protein